MRIAAAGVFGYRLPLREPLQLARQELTEREGLLLRLRDGEGHEGWGEAAPLPGFSEESLAEARRSLVGAAQALAGRDFPERMEELQASALLEWLRHSSVSFAVETAALNLRAAGAGLPLEHTLGRPGVERVAVNALLQGSREAVLERAGQLASEGYGAAKLKVGRAPLEEEIACVRAVRGAIGGGAALRLDANCAWDLDTAVRFGEAVYECGIEYIEEPLKDPFLLAQFQERTGIPFALDESLRQWAAFGGGRPARDATGFCHIWSQAQASVLKPTLLHFPGMLNLLLSTGLPSKTVVLSGAFESGVGTAALARLSAVLCGPSMPCGLDSYHWLERDVVEGAIPFDGGGINLLALAAIEGRIQKDGLTPVWTSGG